MPARPVPNFTKKNPQRHVATDTASATKWQQHLAVGRRPTARPILPPKSPRSGDRVVQENRLPYRWCKPCHAPIKAFIYNEKFDFTGTVAFDTRTSRKARYANDYQYDAYAVLVGEYDTVDHPSVDRDLDRIKAYVPDTLADPNAIAAETSGTNPVTAVKALASKLKRSGDQPNRGPMASAFVTRNPMLPEEYFQSPTVDSFVSQLNDGVPHSLLKCDGKYTVIVKTFQGMATIQDGKMDKKFEPNGKRLDGFAKAADKMCGQLRKQGVEAYQFHDRTRSIVTVGSFDELGRQLPNGQFEYAAPIRKLMKEYSAFNVRPELARQVPRHQNGVASNNIGMVPFDVQPAPIAVPKLSKSSVYKAAFGMR
jgi:hypothetical protein